MPIDTGRRGQKSYMPARLLQGGPSTIGDTYSSTLAGPFIQQDTRERALLDGRLFSMQHTDHDVISEQVLCFGFRGCLSDGCSQVYIRKIKATSSDEITLELRRAGAVTNAGTQTAVIKRNWIIVPEGPEGGCIRDLNNNPGSYSLHPTITGGDLIYRESITNGATFNVFHIEAGGFILDEAVWCVSVTMDGNGGFMQLDVEYEAVEYA